MTLDQLQVLKTIVKSGSFRAASLELTRAQSAVSYAIGSLETELGFKLFSRDQYRPQLSPQGRAFLLKADELIAQYSDLTEIAKFLKRGHEPIIRLAVSALWPLPLLVNALKELNSQFPQTEIQIFQPIEGVENLLESGQVDFSLGFDLSPNSKFTNKEVLPLNMVTVVARQHPLAKLKVKTEAAYTKEFSQVRLRTDATPKSSPKKTAPSNMMSVQDYATLKALVMEGLGWGRLPEHFVANEIKQKHLVTLPSKTEKLRMSIARHSQMDMGPCGKFLWSHFSHRQNPKGK